MIFFEFTIDDIIIHTRIVLITPYDLCSTIRDAVIAFIIRPTGAKKNSAVSNSISFFRPWSLDSDCLQCYLFKWILMHPVTYKVT